MLCWLKTGKTGTDADFFNMEKIKQFLFILQVTPQGVRLLEGGENQLICLHVQI